MSPSDSAACRAAKSGAPLSSSATTSPSMMQVEESLPPVRRSLRTSPSSRGPCASEAQPSPARRAAASDSRRTSPRAPSPDPAAGASTSLHSSGSMNAGMRGSRLASTPCNGSAGACLSAFANSRSHRRARPFVQHERFRAAALAGGDARHGAPGCDRAILIEQCCSRLRVARMLIAMFDQQPVGALARALPPVRSFHAHEDPAAVQALAVELES